MFLRVSICCLVSDNNRNPVVKLRNCDFFGSQLCILVCMYFRYWLLTTTGIKLKYWEDQPCTNLRHTKFNEIITTYYVYAKLSSQASYVWHFSVFWQGLQLRVDKILCYNSWSVSPPTLYTCSYELIDNVNKVLGCSIPQGLSFYIHQYPLPSWNRVTVLVVICANLRKLC